MSGRGPKVTATQRRYQAVLRQRKLDALLAAVRAAGLRPGDMNGCDLDGGCDACDLGNHDPHYSVDGVLCACCGDDITEEMGVDRDDLALGVVPGDS